MSKRYRLRDSDWKLINPRTGEMADIDITVHSRGGKFMKLWQESGVISRVGSLSGEATKLILPLMSAANFGNVVPGPGEMSKAINKRQPNVSRAYKELTNAGILIKQSGIYYLNPHFCWKGNDNQFEQAVKQLTTPLLNQ